MSAAGELAISAAKDLIPARPSARFGSCCMNDSAKFRSMAVTSFLRKISIMAWRARAPKASDVVMVRASGRASATFDKVAIALATTASSMSPPGVGKRRFGDEPVAKSPLRSIRLDLSASAKLRFPTPPAAMHLYGQSMKLEIRTGETQGFESYNH